MAKNLIKMSGANRPAWIDKEMFYKMPFNFCDRFCEKCQLTHLCRVFRNEQKTREKYLKKGKDPDPFEFAFEVVRDNFAKVRKLLQKDAKRLGIDLNNLNESNYQPPPEPEEFPLYNLVNRFSKRLEKLHQELEVIPVEANEELIIENLKVISHYQYLVLGKVYRAFTSRIEEEQDKDDRTFDSLTSVFITINGFIAISEALVNLAHHRPLNVLRKKLLHLGEISLDLARSIDSEFNLNLCY